MHVDECRCVNFVLCFDMPNIFMRMQFHFMYRCKRDMSDVVSNGPHMISYNGNVLSALYTVNTRGIALKFLKGT